MRVGPRPAGRVRARLQGAFLPGPALGRNTGLALGYSPGQMAVWDPRRDRGGLEDRTIKKSTFLLWKGHCSVHQRFRPAHVSDFRSRHPSGVVVVHPECPHETVEIADSVGSTDHIIRYVSSLPKRTVVAVGTEIHLVNRLGAENPHVTVESLDPLVCPCSTMFRIDASHLAWVLENLVEGRVVNRIAVDADTASWARVALERMLAIRPPR